MLQVTGLSSMIVHSAGCCLRSIMHLHVLQEQAAGLSLQPESAWPLPAHV